MTTRTPSPLAVLLTAGLALGCDAEPPTATSDLASPAIPTAASLGQPVHTGVIRVTFPDQVCGVDVTVSVFLAGALFDFLPGGVPSKQTGTVSITWTAANGKSFQRRLAGQTLQQDFGVNEDGTFRVVEIIAGLLGQLKTPHGPVISNDVGRLVLRQRVRLNEDGSATVLESEIIEIAGPHPVFESGTPLATFCEIFLEALA